MISPSDSVTDSHRDIFDYCAHSLIEFKTTYLLLKNRGETDSGFDILIGDGPLRARAVLLNDPEGNLLLPRTGCALYTEACGRFFRLEVSQSGGATMCPVPQKRWTWAVGIGNKMF